MAEQPSPFRGYRPDQIGVGNEGNKGKVNEPGVYYDVQSGKHVEVFHPAAADALVRMGWVKVQVERDKSGEITKVIKPTFGGQTPEDNPEVLELRAKLAEANKKLAAQTKKAKVSTTKKGSN